MGSTAPRKIQEGKFFIATEADRPANSKEVELAAAVVRQVTWKLSQEPSVAAAVVAVAD